MLTAVPLILTFLPDMSFVLLTHCCHTIEFDSTIIQVSGLASYNTRFNPTFST